MLQKVAITPQYNNRMSCATSAPRIFDSRSDYEPAKFQLRTTNPTSPQSPNLVIDPGLHPQRDVQHDREDFKVPSGLIRYTSALQESRILSQT